jgi:glutathione peroxidase-family protein
MLTLRKSLMMALSALMMMMVALPAAMAERKKTDWTAKSVNGRNVNTENYRGQVLMVFLSSPETRDAMKPMSNELVLRYGDNQEVAQLTIVDLRELEFYKRPFAEEHIAKAQGRTVQRIQKLLKDNGKAPIPGLQQKLHLIADFEGQIVKRYNHWDTQKFVTVVVLNKQGDVVGAWKSSQIKEIFEAVDASLAE